MTIIALPPDLEERLADEARRRGTTPELLALDSLRRLFVPATGGGDGSGDQSLFDFLSGHIGTISGSAEPLSEDCGRRFAEGLEETRARGPL